jgi:hypothetical protein
MSVTASLHPQGRLSEAPEVRLLADLDSAMAQIAGQGSPREPRVRMARAALQTLRTIVSRLHGAGSIRVDAGGQSRTMHAVAWQTSMSAFACRALGTPADCASDLNLVAWSFSNSPRDLIWIKGPPGTSAVDAESEATASVAMIRIGDPTTWEARTGRLAFSAGSQHSDCGSIVFPGPPRVHACSRTSFDVAFTGEMFSDATRVAQRLSFLAPGIPGVAATWYGLQRPCDQAQGCIWR